MKQPKKLTRQMKEAVTAHGLNSDNWMLLKESGSYITIVNKESGKIKIIDKHAKTKKGARA